MYSCKVTRLDDFTFETYTGLTEGPFKQRLYGHNSNFKKKKQRNRTMLSNYIWYLKDNKIPFQLNWSILGRAKGFNPVTGVCRLCLLEKYFIMYNSKDASLNSRHELFNSCRHKWKHTLGKTWGRSRFSWFFKKTVSIYQYFFSVQKPYSVSYANLCQIVSDDCISMKQAVIHMTF